MIAEVKMASGSSPQECANALRATWPGSQVVHLRGPAPGDRLLDFYDQVLHLAGEPATLAEDATLGDRESQRTGEVWMEVRYDSSMPDAYRHSANAQPLHTDGSYIPSFPNAGMLACKSMVGEGGETTFLDGPVLVDILERRNHRLLHRLESVRVPHARSGDRRDSTIMARSAEEVFLNWNYYCVAADANPEAKELAEEFFAFLRDEPAVHERTVSLKLAPGDAVFWRDDRLLHGRASFFPTRESERWLLKAAVQITS